MCDKMPGSVKTSKVLLEIIFYKCAEYNNMPTPKMQQLLISGPPCLVFLGLIKNY